MHENLFYCEIRGNKKETEMAMELFAAIDLAVNASTNVEENFTTYTVYSNTNEENLNCKLIIENAIAKWKTFGLHFSALQTSTIKKEDWTEVWKRYFKIQHISPTLVIKASWLDYEPKPGDTVIEIDPGMSFGTGSHETTQSCLKLIENISKKENNLSFLDAGCGSGILSISAAKFGFSPIFAFDYDEECMLATKENMARNYITAKTINIQQADIKDYHPERQFDIVTANIISSVLTANYERLLSWIKPGGHLILAGILRTEYDKIRDFFITENVCEIKTLTEKEWTSGLFHKNK
jgi:ribosomal protein L11 methyltransferase